MRLVCLHKDSARRLQELGVPIGNLTPSGLDGTPYHLVTMSQHQAHALTDLGIDHEDITPNVLANLPLQSSAGFLYCRGGMIPNGTKLRTTYKSKGHEAEVRGGSIWMNGAKYENPSFAARAVGHGSVNGWLVWEYFDKDEDRWQPLKLLRIKLARAAQSHPGAA